MRRFFGRIRALDPGFGVVIAICLVAVWPFIQHPSLPQATDAELHIFRLAELSRLWEAGLGYPRWAPNFYFGYGYPIFNYYAPLAYYLGLPLTALLGLTPVAAVKIVFIAGLLGAGVGMYGFVRDNWGRPAGYVAAAVYVYAPYIQYVDPHARGVLAESVSFAVLPLALWSADRLIKRRTAGAWATTVLSAAAVVLTHNLMALVFGTLLAAWLAWQAAGSAAQARRSGQPWHAVRRTVANLYALPLLALATGVALAGFFWLPLILERNAVNLSTLVGDGSHYDFRNHFLSLRELLAPSLLLDWGASEPAYRLNLGVAQWVLGGLGGAALALQRTQRRTHGAFFAAAAGVLIGLMLPVARPLWEVVPLLPFLQFPWRLVGATVAMLAVLAGILTDAVTRPRGRWTARLPLPVLVGGVLLAGLPLAQVAPWEPFGATSVLRALEIELEGRWLGTTSTADYVPSTVDVVPDPNSFQLENYFKERPVDRFNWVAVPDGTVVRGSVVNPLHMRFATDSAEFFLLRLFLFYFPGWTARVDGEPVAIEIGRPEGFVVVPVPAGEHVVDVTFESTPARRAGWAVSAVALTLLLAGAAWRLRRPAGPLPVYRFGGAEQATLLVALGAFVALTTVLEPAGWLRFDSQGFSAEPAQHAVYADYDGQIALIGYDLHTRAWRPGAAVDVTLYWKAQQPLADNYQVFVHVLRPDGSVLAQSDKLNPGDFPTARWPLDKYVRDAHRLTLPADLPPADYTLTAGLWLQTSGERLYVFDGSGDLVGDYLPLTRVSVAP